MEHPGGYDAFWSEFGERALAVGLYRAARIAAHKVGVHESTGWRWIKGEFNPSWEWWKAVVLDPHLILGALSMIRFRRKFPSPVGVEHWRRMLGWRHPVAAAHGYSEPPASEILRTRGPGVHIWTALLGAATRAAMVVGNGNPLHFWSNVGLIDEGMERLQEGGLLDRHGGVRRFTYWLSFDPPDSRFSHPTIKALVCTSKRVVGEGVAAVSPHPWPPMTVRLDLDHLRADGPLITIPVPSATVGYHHTALEFPLEMDLRFPL